MMLAKVTGLVLFVYLLVWMIAYVIVNQNFDLAAAYEYFVLAWSFEGFVRPMYTWFLANVILVAIVVSYAIYKIRRKKKQEDI